MSDLDIMVREENNIPEDQDTKDWCDKHGYDYRELLMKAWKKSQSQNLQNI